MNNSGIVFEWTTLEIPRISNSMASVLILRAELTDRLEIRINYK